MIRDLGHDLRTPITTMRAGIEVSLAARRTSDQYRKILGSTLEEVDRLALIGDALSLLGRLETGELTASRQMIDLRTVAAPAVTRARERTGGHRVEFQYPPAPVTALADARLLALALDQLLDNAMRHTPPDTPIELVLDRSDGRALLVVEDGGPGVPDEVLPHLFERFYRADAARGRNGGPGLGLTVVAAIAELHQGRAVAERGRETGLRVRIELPERLAPG
jgi:signal transduction histidine kinase